MKLYTVKANSFSGVYNAGRYVAGSPEGAKQKAKEEYMNSPMGRQLKDVGRFSFFIPHEESVDG